MSYFINTAYDNGWSTNFIRRKTQVSATLKELKVHIDEDFITHYALNQLPPYCGQLKVTNVAQKDNYIIDELISICGNED